MAKKVDLTGKQFGKLTVLKKSDKKHPKGTVWECQCECGNIYYGITSELNNGRVKSCGCLRVASGRQKAKNDIIGKKFGLLTVIERVPDPNNPKYTKFLCQCECGNLHLVSRKHLINRHVNSCGCLKTSLGELKIQQLLEENNFTFEKEKTFSTCRSPLTNYPLRFDFFVNNSYLIEYDGRQHSEADGGWGEDLKAIQDRDRYKELWCKEHNIPLIRISYKQYDSLTIDDLIPSENK